MTAKTKDRKTTAPVIAGEIISAKERPTILVMGGAAGPIIQAGGVVNRRGTTEDVSGLIRSGKVDGLLLTGGGDVDPLLYAKEKHPRVYGVDGARDDAEWDAITAANEMDIPMMGICRGAQIINVAFGGTLHQNITDDPDVHSYHSGHDHRVKAVPGSRLQKAWGEGEKATRYVISIHHQAVDRVADGFVATGFGLDGVIEAIESVEGWVLGVQFHPEMAYDKPYQQRIFNRFVAACARNRGMKWKMPKTQDRPPVKLQPGQKFSSSRLESQRQESRKRNPDKYLTGTWGSPVTVTWKCFVCNMTFDEKVDHTDHMAFFHGVFAEDDE